MGTIGLTCVAVVQGGGAFALVQSQLRGADIWARADTPNAATTLSYAAIAMQGTRIFVLDNDAEQARDLLASTPLISSSGIRGWRMILACVMCWYCSVPTSPFGVWLPHRPASVSKMVVIS